ncbi:Folate transporter 1 [Ranunculus cassubicifolius]
MMEESPIFRFTKTLCKQSTPLPKLSLYFFFYNKAKNRHSKGGEKKLTAGLHLLSAAEAGALVSLFTNPV